MMRTIQLYQNVPLKTNVNLAKICSRKYTAVIPRNKLLIGRATHLSNNKFELLHILAALNKLKINGIRGRKRFGLLLKLIPTSIGHDRLSHSFVQTLFSFKDQNFTNWLTKSSLLRLYIVPFLEKCIILSPPELISGYSLPLIQLGIKSDIFKTRLATSTIDYGTHFPLEQILHSICYLHWHQMNSLESVITLANLITDVGRIVSFHDSHFSIGNLVQWLSELGIRHDPLLEQLEQFLLEPASTVTSNCGQDTLNMSREYVRMLLMEKGEFDIPGDAFISFRQHWPEDRHVSFKKIGNAYFWYTGRFKYKPLMAIGMDKINSIDLCKIVVFGKFATNNLFEAIVYDYSPNKYKGGYTRCYKSVDGELFGRFILKLAIAVKIPHEIANYFIDTAIEKLKQTSLTGKEAMIEASFHMGISVWHKWPSSLVSSIGGLTLKSLAYIHLMDLPNSHNSVVKFANKFNLNSFGSLPFTAILTSDSATTSGGGLCDKYVTQTRKLVPLPRGTSFVPVYDRSTFHNYKWNKSKGHYPRGIEDASNRLSDQIVDLNKMSHISLHHANSDTYKDLEVLKTSEIAILAIINQLILNGSKNISNSLLEIITNIGRFRRYMTTPYSKIDQAYTLWTSAPAQNYNKRIQAQLDKLGSTDSVDPRFTILQSDENNISATDNVDKFERSKSNKMMDRPFGLQKRLEYFEEYLHRLSKQGMLLFESASGEIQKTSSLENNVYQTLLSFHSREEVKKQVCATTFTIDLVITPRQQ